MSNADKNWKNKALRDLSFDEETLTIGAKRLPVAEVSVGDEIVTSWRSGSWPNSRTPLKTSKVSERKPCDGHNGLHVHLNKNNCYDSRAFVWVAR